MTFCVHKTCGEWVNARWVRTAIVPDHLGTGMVCPSCRTRYKTKRPGRWGVDEKEAEAPPSYERMSPETFRRWLTQAKSRGWSKREVARLLGCHRDTIREWETGGAPLYVGLACTALMAGLPPWGSVETGGRYPGPLVLFEATR